MAVIGNISGADQVARDAAAEALNAAPEISVDNYGATPSTSLTGGNDQYSYIAAAVAAAQALAANSPGTGQRFPRPKVVFSPGVYTMASPLEIPYGVDLDMAGAEIYYTGTRTSHAILIGEDDKNDAFGSYENIAIRAPVITSLDYDDYETCVGVRVQCQSRARFSIRKIENFSIGLQLRGSGKTNGYIGYNDFYLNGRIGGCRYSIDLRTGLNDTWVNENRFWGGDCSPQNSYVGSAAGVRFSKEAGSTGNQNSNKFFGLCVENNALTSTYTLSVSLAVSANVCYVNTSLTPPRVYLCEAAGNGVVTTIPTHTTLDTATYDTTKTWRDLGPFFRCVLFHDQAGWGSNSIAEGRFEDGYGKAIVVRGTNSLSYPIALENKYDIAFVTGNSVSRGIDYDSWTTSSMGNRLSSHVTTPSVMVPKPVVIDNIHLRAIGSASGLAIQGLHWWSWSDNQNAFGAYRTDADNSFKILKDAVWMSTVGGFGGYFGCPAVFVPITPHYRRFAVHRQHAADGGSYSSGGDLALSARNIGTLMVTPFDRQRKVVDLPNTDATLSNWFLSNGVSTLHSSGSSWKNTHQLGTTAQSPLEFGQGSLSTITVFQAAVQSAYASQEWTSLLIQPMGDGVLGPFVPYTAFESSTERAQRFSYGTPTAGHFPMVGETIRNINKTTDQPLWWIVTTAGILAAAWTGNSTAWIAGELCVSGGNVYAAQAAGTGTTNNPGTGPSGTTTSVDGGVTWEYLAPAAVLTPSTTFVAALKYSS